MAVIDLTLSTDPTVDNAPAISAALGNLVRLPPGEFSVGATIMAWQLVGKGPGETRLKVMREALPSELGPTGLSQRQHIRFRGIDPLGENIRVIGRNTPVATTGRPAYLSTREFEHAFDFRACTRPKLFGCRGDYVWGDGWYIGPNEGGSTPCTDLVIDDFESLGVGRQTGAISALIGKSLIRAHRIVGLPRRSGIDVEPYLGLPVSGVEFTSCILGKTQLHPFNITGNGMISVIWIHDNDFAGNEVHIRNGKVAAGRVFRDIRFERNTHTGGVGPGVRFEGIVRPVVLDNVNDRVNNTPASTTPAIRVRACSDVFIRRNRATGSAQCVGPDQGTTGTIGAPLGTVGENTHIPWAGGIHLPEVVMLGTPAIEPPVDPIFAPVVPVPPPPPPPSGLTEARVREIAREEIVKARHFFP